jgi:hypothetical protein
MYRATSLLLLLVAFAWLACQWPGVRSAESGQATVDWRRTIDGWERFPIQRSIEPYRRPPAVHPLMVAGLELLVALGICSRRLARPSGPGIL